MADDYAGDATTTGSITLGSSISGNLDFSNDQDWFAISMIAGRNYEIDLAATTTFSGGGLGETLLSPSGTRISGGNGVKTLSLTPTTSGTYYVDVGAYSGATGGYLLTASPFDDYTGDFSTTGRLANGGTTSGVLEGSGDVDDFAVSLTAGLTYLFTLTPTVSFSGYGLSATLINSSGVSVSSASRNVLYTPTISGTYFLAVGAPPGSTGGYSLAATPLDDFTDDMSTTGRLSIGGTVSGTLESVYDSDWFAVTLVAGTSYTFSVTGASQNNGYVAAESLVNSSGIRIAGVTGTKTITYKPSVSGTYYLDVTGGNFAAGSYAITTVTNSAATGSSPGTSTTASVPVYRFFDSTYGTQFLTSSSSERDTINATRPDLSYEGVGLEAAASTDPSASPVYRFFDTHYGTHFYTSNSSERDAVQATRPDLTYEGVGFYEYAGQQSNTTPVYRFFDSNRGTHFYTSSATEEASILSTRPDLIAEGVSFYAPSA